MGVGLKAWLGTTVYEASGIFHLPAQWVSTVVTGKASWSPAVVGLASCSRCSGKCR